MVVKAVLSKPKETTVCCIYRPRLTLQTRPFNVVAKCRYGKSWTKVLLIDEGASGYSSLQVGYVDGTSHGLLLLYEQSDRDELIMAPARFIFRAL